MTRRQVFQLAGYIFLLLLFFEIANIGVAGVVFQFILKDTLKLRPEQQATFGFLADAPYFCAFAFGFLRDRWRPFQRGDRGYFLLLPPLLCGANLLLAFGPFTYARLLIASLLLAAVSTWLGAAVGGLKTIIAQDRGMAGRISSLTLMTPNLVGMLASFVGGRLAAPAHQHQAFLISAALCLPLMVMAFWRPGIAVAERDETRVRVAAEGGLVALKRLVRSPSVFLPAVILFLWSFAPGWGTPLFFYVTNTVKLSAKTYGACGSVQGGGMLLALLVYAGLCCRFRLRLLLWWGTLMGVLGCPLFLLIHSPVQAYPVFFLAGVSLGIALCAYHDLLIRCCPKGLEGMALMVTTAASAFAGDTSDIFGSWLYEKGGFTLALIVSTVFTALIFAVLPFIPKRFTIPPEGEPLLEDGAGSREAALRTPGIA